MLRCIAFIVLFSMCFYSTEVVCEEYSQNEITEKIQSFKKMKATGFTLFGIGSVSLIGGILLMSTAEWESHSTATGTQMTTNDPSGGAGIVLLVAGIPMTIAGIVLGSIGSKKTREYKYRLQTYSKNGYTGLNFVMNY